MSVRSVRRLNVVVTAVQGQCHKAWTSTISRGGGGGGDIRMETSDRIGATWRHGGEANPQGETGTKAVRRGKSEMESAREQGQGQSPRSQDGNAQLHFKTFPTSRYPDG